MIEASLPLPETVEGGIIVRDDSGKPTGMLRFIISPNYTLSCQQ